MDVLKRDFLVKRAQLKSKLTRENFKGRWFELTHTVLRYLSGSLENGVGDLKGQIVLKNIVAVEEASSEPFDGRKNAFQIVYHCEDTSVLNTLYVFALHDYKRTEWILALKIACENLNSKCLDKYHPGAWSSKYRLYSCCKNPNKSCNGCTNTTTLNMHLPKPQSSNSNNSKQRVVAEVQPMIRPKVVALYNYENTNNKGQLGLIKGHEYFRLSSAEDENWIQICDQNGNEGIIPKSLVQDSSSDLTNNNWFYPNLTRLQCEMILQEDGREAVFLVRMSRQHNFYTLSLFTKLAGIEEGIVKHYMIKETKEGQFYFSINHTFDNIPDLIYYHKHNCAGLIVRLRCCPKDEKDTLPYFPLPPGVYNIDPASLDIKEILGSGQFGTVQRALYRGTEVAVKCMNEGSMLEEDFLEEAKTMMQFDHENLVRLYGICTSCKPIIIVTEYMSNGALLSYVRTHKSHLSTNQGILVTVCQDVCRGMRHLESKGVIHRDLAARNCLVGKHGLVKVGDFGLSRLLLDNMYMSSAGTKLAVRWASPEVLGNSRYSNKSDVWAFGILMWEVFSLGDEPYPQMKNSQVIESVCKQKYRMPMPSSCSPPIYQIMQDCWKQNDVNRPAFHELYRQFEELQINMQDYVE